MKTILITGANRGLGLEFARQYLESKHRVFATCRRPQKADALKELQERHADHLSVLPLDVADEASIKIAAHAAGRHSRWFEYVLV